MESVENILRELHLEYKPRIVVLNKTDKISGEEAKNLAVRYNAAAVSALDPSTLSPLLKAIEEHIWTEKLEAVKV
jgi:GTP-binding protein HflX